ncbi:MAG: glutaredoxin family protein, partial [Acidobacteria bacterium]|nr:glutaredoxin family protein [Acidobacteriota bacterium]
MVDASPPLPEVVLYTRAGCHLCDEAKQQLQQLRKQADFHLREIDIDQDAELRQLYNDEVPVIFIGSRKAFKYRINSDRFLKRLQAPGTLG